MTMLELDGVWKSFPDWNADFTTLRGAIARRTPWLLRRNRRWALQDVSVSMEPGASIAVIGHNGAGKSTLLRVASGLSRPTRGSVRAPRRTASVLSLESWFDPKLTGRENAMTAAVVLGFGRREARALVPAIFDFAEIPDFADSPVRVYSDGMRLRLAFGVVAQLEPELLVVDEALAVGDLGFQAKCVRRIREMRDKGTALLLASHDLGQVVNECAEAVWLEGGRIREIGPAGAIVSGYREAGRAETLARTPAEDRDEEDGLALHVNRFGSQALTLHQVSIHGPAGSPEGTVPAGGSLTITCSLHPHDPRIADPVLLASIVRLADDVVCAECSSAGGLRLGPVRAPMNVALEIDRLDLAPGEYAVDLGVYPADWAYAYDYHWRAHRLRVSGEGGAAGVMRPPYRWTAAGPIGEGDE
jgi:lipopolysaccharide transport system ATP-binding protein